jgi:hypothetical protein
LSGKKRRPEHSSLRPRNSWKKAAPIYVAEVNREKVVFKPHRAAIVGRAHKLSPPVFLAALSH